MTFAHILLPLHRRYIGSSVLALALGILLVPVSYAGDSEPAPAGWHAYVKDGSDQKPVKNPDELGNKDWARVQYSEFSGSRIRIAVAPVQSELPGASHPQLDYSDPYWFWSWWSGYNDVIAYSGGELPVGDIGSLMTAALQNTHRFTVLERSAIEQILNEQNMGQGGRVNRSTAPQIGQLIGAQYLILASVNSWNPSASSAGGRGFGIVGGLVGGVGVNTKKARVEMTFRVVNATTGEVVDPVARTKGESGGFKLDMEGIGWGGPLLAGLGHLSKDPEATIAVVAAINKAVYQIATQIEAAPWSTKVIKVSGSEISLKGGKDAGVTVGMELTAYHKGEALKDPDTGEVLANELTEIGKLTVIKVFDAYSVASISEGCAGITVGDQAKQVAESHAEK